MCSHGKTFDERCIGCELVLAREALASARNNVNRYEQALRSLIDNSRSGSYESTGMAVDEAEKLLARQSR
jgi:hypothetical protein